MAPTEKGFLHALCYVKESLSLNPAWEDGDARVGRASSTTSLSGNSALAGESVYNLYKRQLFQVLAIWPKLSALSDIDIRQLSASALQALRTLYVTSLEQLKEREALQRARVADTTKLNSLEERAHAKEDELRRKQAQVAGLDHEVSILTGELRRRGFEPRLLERGERPLVEEPPSDYDVIASDRSKHVTPSVSSATSDDCEAETGEPCGNSRRGKAAMFIATPLLQASGNNKQSFTSAIVKRSLSLRPIGDRHAAAGTTGPKDNASPPEISHAVDDLNQKLRSLQHSLEEEKRRSAALEERLDTFGEPAPMTSLSIALGPTQDTLKGLYDELGNLALSRVMTSLGQLLHHIPTPELYQFICSTMFVAFEEAGEQYRRFQDTLHSLLTSPTSFEIASSRRPDNKRHPGGNVNRFSKEQSSNSVPGSRLAQRTAVSAELPRHLEEEVENFIRLTADSVTMDHLAEVVGEGLVAKWPQCATATVLNHSAFSDFLHGCCRLAWRLCTTAPAYHVTADATRYDERYHVVLPTDGGIGGAVAPSIGAELEYYVWPELHRTRYGEVVCRGRVVLTRRR